MTKKLTFKHVDEGTGVGSDAIPDFLRRTETEAQAEARRKKHAPKDDSKGLKVITPPDPKISAAIAKDFAETKKKEKLAAVKADVERFRDGKTDPFKNIKAFIEKGQAAQKAVDKINAARVKDGLRPYTPNKSAKPPKKAGSLVEKAIKARDALAVKQGVTDSAKPPKTAKKAAAKSAPKKGSAERKAKYEKLLAALARKNGVDNAELAKVLGRRPSSASMKTICENHGKKLKIVKKEGEPTRYMTA